MIEKFKKFKKRKKRLKNREEYFKDITDKFEITGMEVSNPGSNVMNPLNNEYPYHI